MIDSDDQIAKQWEGTEFGDALRKQGIIKDDREEKRQKEIEKAEEEQRKWQETIDAENQKQLQIANDNDDLAELGLDDDDDIVQQYREKRMAELKAAAIKMRFGDVREITAEDYIDQVNKAGEGIWVVLHLYNNGNTTCKLINQFLEQLAIKFPYCKFLRSIASLCVANYPDANCPTIFVYYNGQLIKQIIGENAFGGTKLTRDGLEWMLSQCGAFKTTLEKDPRKLEMKKGSKKTFITSFASGGDDEESDSD